MGLGLATLALMLYGLLGSDDTVFFHHGQHGFRFLDRPERPFHPLVGISLAELFFPLFDDPAQHPAGCRYLGIGTNDRRHLAEVFLEVGHQLGLPRSMLSPSTSWTRDSPHTHRST